MGVNPSRRLDRRRVHALEDRGLRLEPVTVDTEDGQTWDGLVLIPHRGGDRARRRLAVIVVHGSVGNYISGVPRRVSHGLALEGFTVLSVNTRMANFGAFFGGGLLHRTPLDLDAWVGLARRMGHHRIVLLGYSLGATMVTHYQALRRHDHVVGLCTLAHPRSLPESLRRRWERFGADPDYATVTRRARAMLGASIDDDGGPDEIFIVEQASGPTLAPTHAEIWTYRTWWHSRGPEARSAVSADWIDQVGVPLALIQAGEDMIVRPDDGEELAAIARAAGVPDVRLESVSEANHVFSGREQLVVDRCAAWIEEVILRQ
jgi:dienelactone hydrolase